MRATHLVITMPVLAIVGCGDNLKIPTGPAAPDAPPGIIDCVQDGTTAGGMAMLGTGRDDFETMPDPLPIEYGVQDGFDLVANVKMSGLSPGNPASVLDPSNPRSFILAYFADTNIPLNYYAHCPFSVGYMPTGDGSYVLPEGEAVVFETCWRAQHLIGKSVRVDLYVVDDNGRYAQNSVTVTLAAPTGPYPMEAPMPGCMH